VQRRVKNIWLLYRQFESFLCSKQSIPSYLHRAFQYVELPRFNSASFFLITRLWVNQIWSWRQQSVVKTCPSTYQLIASSFLDQRCNLYLSNGDLDNIVLFQSHVILMSHYAKGFTLLMSYFSKLQEALLSALEDLLIFSHTHSIPWYCNGAP